MTVTGDVLDYLLATAPVAITLLLVGNSTLRQQPKAPARQQSLPLRIWNNDGWRAVR